MSHSDRRLTILLTLKGRTPFTFRWMSYADSIQFPFPVYIADGSADDSHQHALSDKTRFPNVSYEYVRYPADMTYRDFYAKVADSLSRIRTPFVALADNDDFFIVDGLRAALAFLSEHPEYATCGGQRAAFWLRSSTTPTNRALFDTPIEWKCSGEVESVCDATASDRLRSQASRATYEVYHHIRRSEQLRGHFHTVCNLDLADFFLYPQLLAFLTAIEGRTRQLPTLYIAQQLNAPDSSAATHISGSGDWLGRMLAPSWSEDFTKFLLATSTALAERDRISLDEARRCVVEAYRMDTAQPLLVDTLKEPTVSAVMSLVVWSIRRMLVLPPDSAARQIARAVYRRAPWISVDMVHGRHLSRRRVPGAWRDIGPIHDFLTAEPSSNGEPLWARRTS